MNYDLVKVFDCQRMSSTLRKEFFEATMGKGNDCYVSWYVTELGDDGYTSVDKWLVDNGAICGEKVIINHWW